jgi:3-hydroxyacyl-[acyl-carrier-protein] dehydratase
VPPKAFYQHRRLADPTERSDQALNYASIADVLELLPHRYPFLLVDRVAHCEPGKSIIAIKQLTANEPWVEGHFPGRPLMPGALVIEAMAQAAGLLAFLSEGESPKNLSLYLAGVDQARIHRDMVPGDRLDIEVQFLSAIRQVWRLAATVRVDGELVASAELMCAARIAPG